MKRQLALTFALLKRLHGPKSTRKMVWSYSCDGNHNERPLSFRISHWARA